MLPLRHHSCLRVLGPLPLAASTPVEEETPLFAAEPAVAHRIGGPLTRAFVDSLPAEWLGGVAAGALHRVLVDSSLVWLTPGIAHGFDAGGGAGGLGPRARPGFLHEPFPGIATGVRGAANRDLSATHRMCVLGLECTPLVVEGALDFATAEQAERFWLPEVDFAARDREVERRLAAGLLTVRALAAGTLVEFGWGTLMRAQPATTRGFQLVLRATAGDPRPAVNGVRNLAML